MLHYILICYCLVFLYSHGLKYEAPDDCQWQLYRNNEVSLVCTLSSINGDSENTNFSVIPSEHTTFLTLQCNTANTKSSLSEQAFNHLKNLRQFAIQQCKIHKWSSNVLYGLTMLKNLTINTHNSLWQLTISDKSFDNVQRLEYIDLSYNNLWTFPPYLFCHLNNLVTLNVSYNNLQDISDLKFTFVQYSDVNVTGIVEKRSCNLDNIQILDVSYNSFGHIPGNTLSALRRLHELRINNNGLISMSDRALNGLKHLKILDISNNKLIAFPPSMFHDCRELTELYLQNNTLVAMPSDLFSGLIQLVSLDLSRNRLTSTWLNNNTFSGLIRLVLLNLSYNKISKLQGNYFRDLYTLQILHLEHNVLETLPADTFAPMNNLHTLILSYNRIKSLEPASFSGLFALSFLALDSNALPELYADALRNCTALQDLTLNGNTLTKVPTALNDMRLLKTLDLGENNIESLDNPVFKGMNNLQGLRLTGNNIKHLTKYSFKELPSLQILNIANNKINIIENDTFLFNLNLQAIRLDSNEITNINGLFTHLNKLEWMNISNNEISSFDYTYIPMSLMWLDMHTNKITELQDKRNKIKEMKIKTIDVSFNKLSRISASMFPSSIELLFLNENEITTVDPLTFVEKMNLTRVDLYANQITNMELSALHLTPVIGERPLPEFYIGGNPFQCDCTMDWLQRINTLDQLRQHPRIMDLDNIYCKLPYSRQRRFMPLLEADSSHFVCRYETHCFALCHCCEFDACDCKMQCPSNCTCYHDQSWSAANTVDCSSTNHLYFPGNIPMDAKVVYLDGNHFGELPIHLFIGRKNLDALYLNNSKINVIHNHTFSGLKRLRVLHMNENLLHNLHGFEFYPLEDLRELYLEKNHLVHINNHTFSTLHHLQILRLDGNRLHIFPVSQLTVVRSLISVTLADNNWSCNCQYLRDFRLWLRLNLAKVTDSANIACVLKTQPLVDGSVAKKIGTYMADFNSTACSSFLVGGSYLDSEFDSNVFSFNLPLLLSIFTAFVLLTSLICLIIRRKQNSTSFWLRCGLKLCYKANATTLDERSCEDSPRQYDAFIVYSVRDDEFVSQVLASTLDDQYRLCLQHRNSHSSISLIDAMENARRTILVFSQQFMATEWRRSELRCAFREILQRNLRRRRKLRIIVVALGDTPLEDIDPDLRMTLSRATCLRWNEKRFWQRLKTAMPDVKNQEYSVNSRELNLGIGNNSQEIIHTGIGNNSRKLHSRIGNNSKESHSRIDNNSQELHSGIGNHFREVNSGIGNNRQYDTLEPARFLPRALESHLQNELWD